MGQFSLFSSAVMSDEDITRTLTSKFQLLPDPMGTDWIVSAAPEDHPGEGPRQVLVMRGGDEDIASFNPEGLARVKALLDDQVPRTRIGFAFSDNIEVHQGGVETDPTTGHEKWVDRSYTRANPALEGDVAISIAGLFARSWPVAADNHAGLSWRQEAWLEGTPPPTLQSVLQQALRATGKLIPHPSFGSPHFGAWHFAQSAKDLTGPDPTAGEQFGARDTGYETVPPPVARPDPTQGSTDVLAWAKQHVFLSILIVVGVLSLLTGRGLAGAVVNVVGWALLLAFFVAVRAVVRAVIELTKKPKTHLEEWEQAKAQWRNGPH